MPNLHKTDQDRRYYLLGLRIVGDFGITIAVPVVVFTKIGQWLDYTHPIGNWPWWMIIGFVLAGALTAKMIVVKAKRYGKIYQKIGEGKQ
jgi:hypothetical protein